VQAITDDWKRTPFWRLLLAVFLGTGGVLAPMVLLGMSLMTFKLIEIVGPGAVTGVYGMAAGIQSFSIIFLGILGGVIADKTRVNFGRRRIWILLGSILGGISLLVLAMATTVWMAITAWVVMQFFYGIVQLSCMALIPEQAEKKRFGTFSGVMGIAGPLTVMAGMILLGVFAQTTLMEKFIGLIVVQLVTGGLAVLLIRDNYVPVPVISENKPPLWERIKNFYPSPKKYPNYTWGLLTRFFINICNGTLTYNALFFMSRFHFDQPTVLEKMAILAPGIAIMAVAGLIGGMLSDKFKMQKPFVMGAAIITTISLVGQAFSYDFTYIIIAQFIFNFGFGLYSAVDNALTNRILPSKENTGKDLSIMNVTVNISSSLVSFVAPSIIALGSGDYTLFLLVMSAFGILSALVVIPIPELKKELAAEATYKA